MKLGDIFLQQGAITEKQLNEALKESRRSGELLGTTLIRLQMITERTLLEALSKQFNVSFYSSLRSIIVDLSVIDKVPVKFVWHYKFMPISLKGNILQIALSNPLEVWPSEDIKLHLGFDTEIILAPYKEIMEAIQKYYGVGADTVEKILGGMDTAQKDEKITESKQNLGEDIEKTGEDPTIVKLVDQIITKAVESRATDIHFEPYGEKVRVRCRLDGVLYNLSIPEKIKYLYLSVVSRIKIISGLDVLERRLPQDGRAKIKYRGKDIDLRISIIPGFYGESIVIRILPENPILKFEDLGILEGDIKKIKKLINSSHGIIFLTGPTGSGKTTTLYTSLMSINKDETKIITIEDPVEYALENITQIQVVPKINFTFANALRSILRHDPDVMMIGEVRDQETAGLAIRCALTGHLVLSTLHTNDSASGITRLIDMGIEPFLVASSVKAFMAQRLIRTVCKECKVDEKMEKPIETKNIRIDSYFRGKGCQDCKFTGYSGRVAIYELLIIDEDIKDMIMQRLPSSKIKEKAVEKGMKTLVESGWEKVKLGVTTPSEVLRVTEIEDNDIRI